MMATCWLRSFWKRSSQQELEMRDLFADEALCVEAIAQALSDPHEVARALLHNSSIPGPAQGVILVA